MASKGVKLSRLLREQHLPFGHGGNYWRDHLRLDQWESAIQPVVYIGRVYNGYQLLRRLSDFVWLTMEPKSQRYMALKMLARTAFGDQELKICRLLKQQPCHSSIATMIGDFMIPHHRESEGFSDEYSVLVLPIMGPSIRRYYEEGSVLSIDDQKDCIRSAVRGVAHIHKLGGVHADLHPGNLCLPAPEMKLINQSILSAPKPTFIYRRDGQPLSKNLPQWVVEPMPLERGNGPSRIIDFGSSFLLAESGPFWSAEDFGIGKCQQPPELLRGVGLTKWAQKVDSWSMALLIFFILSHGKDLFDTHDTARLLEQIRDHRGRIHELLRGYSPELPLDCVLQFGRMLQGLLQEDPVERTPVIDLEKDRWLMDPQASESKVG